MKKSILSIKKFVFRGVAVMSSLVFLLAQYGYGDCLLWQYCPKVPEKNNKIKIKDL